MPLPFADEHEEEEEEDRGTCVPTYLRRGTSLDQSPVACAHRLISEQASGFRFPVMSEQAILRSGLGSQD
jgi:hypothetical protein